MSKTVEQELALLLKENPDAKLLVSHSEDDFDEWSSVYSDVLTCYMEELTEVAPDDRLINREQLKEDLEYHCDIFPDSEKDFDKWVEDRINERTFTKYIVVEVI